MDNNELEQIYEEKIQSIKKELADKYALALKDSYEECDALRDKLIAQQEKLELLQKQLDVAKGQGGQSYLMDRLDKNGKITRGKIMYDGIDLTQLHGRDWLKIRGSRIAAPASGPLRFPMPPTKIIERSRMD